MQQVLVNAAAQEEGPRVAIGNAGQAAITRPGTADGASSPAQTGERRPLYRLQKSDIVEVRLAFIPEFDQTAAVQPDGLLALRELKQIPAEGMTVAELEEAIRASYADILRDPQVTVILKDFAKPYFIASGEVTRPGKYELRGDTTLSEALAMAGGLNKQAKHSQVVLFRRVGSSGFEPRTVNVKAMLNSRNLAEDIHLRPGDVVFVPQNTISKVRRYLPASSLGMYLNSTQF